MEKNMIFGELDNSSLILRQLMLPLNEEQLNTIPFAGSWTAAQLATHITKSNNAIAQALNMEGTPAGRNPAERIIELEKIFLDFNHKMTSPAFIAPPPGRYQKITVITALEKSEEQLKEKRAQADLSEAIAFEAFGHITRLELLYFVWYHTRRHIHQLKNILKHLGYTWAND